MASLIPAAGTLPWRRRAGRLEVALVHRPKYDDWSWPKGKLDPGEQPCVTAVRETLEETGLQVRLGMPLPTSEYPVLDVRGAPATKQVHYWAAKVTGGSGVLENEIDEVAWVDVRTANDRLDYARDREQLLALIRAEREDALRTWPLLLVRHGKAKPRSSWQGVDCLRPLDAVGHEQARGLKGVLAAYDVTRVVTSSSLRCVQTVEPYAAERGVRVRSRDCLSEEAFAEDPSGALEQLGKLLDRGEPAALCGHGPVLPTLIDRVGAHVSDEDTRSMHVCGQLHAAADSKLHKGEVLVAHVRGRGARARVVAVERVGS